jgi:hypothetical protein
LIDPDCAIEIVVVPGAKGTTHRCEVVFDGALRAIDLLDRVTDQG